MAMIDPSEFELDGAVEPAAVKGGEEYELNIVSVNEGTDKNDLKYLMPRLEVVGDPFSKEFTYFLHLPNKKKMSEKQLNRARFAYRSFCECFSIDTTRAHDPKDEWPGHKGFAILGRGEDEQYGEQNYIKRLVTPQ